MLNNGAAQKACHARGENVHEKSVVGAAACSRCDACVGAGKNLRTEDFALGAGLAFAAEGAGGLGGCGRKGFRRHHQVQGVSGAAARQGVRPLRHGARWHRRRHLRQSRLPAGPVPDHRRRRIAVPDVGSQGRLDGARRLVPQICREGDEGRQVLSRLRPFAIVVSFADQEDRRARRHQGHEDPSRPCHHGQFRHPARRHQRAVLGAGGPRHHRARRRRRRHLPVGLAAAVRHRQGDEVRHGGAALCHDLRLRDQQGQVQPDVRQAEEGDRQQLQHRDRRQGRRILGQDGGRRDREDQGEVQPRGLQAHARADRTWKKAAEPLVKTWGEGVKKNGGDPDAALAELKASLTKYNALAQ